MPELQPGRCPACGGGQPEILLTVENAPVSCAQLFATHEAAQSAGNCRLEITICKSCAHIWNAAHKDAPEALYNDDYYSSFTASSQAREYQEALASDLDRLIGLDGKTVCEIGCGDGFFLNSLNAMGAKAIGFEPSSTFDLAAAYPGIKVIRQPFDFDATADAGFRVDLIVMRHVLEHLPSPKEVLEALDNKCFGGVPSKFLLLEVPNTFQLLQDNLYFDFYNDHIHYFSNFSLNRLLASTGWISLTGIEPDGEFVRILCLNSSKPNTNINSLNLDGLSAEKDGLLSSAKGFRESFQLWKDKLTGIVQEAGQVAVWGAGARGVALLSGLGLSYDSFRYVVDSDASKHGRFLPSAQMPIYLPEQLRLDPVDSILVTSYTYFNEIFSQLEWFRSAGGKVIRAYPVPELVD